MANAAEVRLNVKCIFKNQKHINALQRFFDKVNIVVTEHCDLEEQAELENLFNYAMGGLVADTSNTEEGNAIDAVENI